MSCKLRKSSFRGIKDCKPLANMVDAAVTPPVPAPAALHMYIHVCIYKPRVHVHGLRKYAF